MSEIHNFDDNAPRSSSSTAKRSEEIRVLYNENGQDLQQEYEEEVLNFDSRRSFATHGAFVDDLVRSRSENDSELKNVVDSETKFGSKRTMTRIGREISIRFLESSEEKLTTSHSESTSDSDRVISTESNNDIVVGSELIS